MTSAPSTCRATIIGGSHYSCHKKNIESRFPIWANGHRRQTISKEIGSELHAVGEPRQGHAASENRIYAQPMFELDARADLAVRFFYSRSKSERIATTRNCSRTLGFVDLSFLERSGSCCLRI